MAKVYRVELMVLATEPMSQDDMLSDLLRTRYCIPSVLAIESRDVDFHDDHPLNHKDTQAEAMKELFKK